MDTLFKIGLNVTLLNLVSIIIIYLDATGLHKPASVIAMVVYSVLTAVGKVGKDMASSPLLHIIIVLTNYLFASLITP